MVLTGASYSFFPFTIASTSCTKSGFFLNWQEFSARSFPEICLCLRTFSGDSSSSFLACTTLFFFWIIFLIGSNLFPLLWFDYFPDSGLVFWISYDVLLSLFYPAKKFGFFFSTTSSVLFNKLGLVLLSFLRKAGMRISVEAVTLSELNVLYKSDGLEGVAIFFKSTGFIRDGRFSSFSG